MLRYNSNTDTFEGYFSDNEWKELCTTCGAAVPNSIIIGGGNINANADGTPVNNNSISIGGGNIDANANGTPVGSSTINSYTLDLDAGGTTADWTFDSAEIGTNSHSSVSQTSWTPGANGGTLVFDAEDGVSVQVKINATAGNNLQFDGDAAGGAFSITQSGTADIQNITTDATSGEYIITFNTSGSLSSLAWALTVEAVTEVIVSSTMGIIFDDYIDNASRFAGGVDGANFPVTVSYTLTNVPSGISPAGPGAIDDGIVSGTPTSMLPPPGGSQKAQVWTGTYTWSLIGTSVGTESNNLTVPLFGGGAYDVQGTEDFFYITTPSTIGDPEEELGDGFTMG